MAESRSDPGAGGEASERVLSATEQSYIDDARGTAFILYEGKRTPHRSCGIALAETFGLPTRPYQILRRGGITGQGTCGALRAGEHVLGELLGDPDPTGMVTPRLRAAITWYQTHMQAAMGGRTGPDVTCDRLVRPLGDFLGAARQEHCTNLAAQVAAATAEALVRFAPDACPPIVAPDQP